MLLTPIVHAGHTLHRSVDGPTRVHASTLVTHRRRRGRAGPAAAAAIPRAARAFPLVRMPLVEGRASPRHRRGLQSPAIRPRHATQPRPRARPTDGVHATRTTLPTRDLPDCPRCSHIHLTVDAFAAAVPVGTRVPSLTTTPQSPAAAPRGRPRYSHHSPPRPRGAASTLLTPRPRRGHPRPTAHLARRPSTLLTRRPAVDAPDARHPAPPRCQRAGSHPLQRGNATRMGVHATHTFTRPWTPLRRHPWGAGTR